MLGPREAGAGGRHCGQNRPVREEEWEIRSERLGGGARGGGAGRGLRRRADYVGWVKTEMIWEIWRKGGI